MRRSSGCSTDTSVRAPREVASIKIRAGTRVTMHRPLARGVRMDDPAIPTIGK